MYPDGYELVPPDPLYTAPYEAWPVASAAPDCYYLEFNQGYQIHNYGWLDRDTDEPAIALSGRTEEQLACSITEDQLQRIRHHPGVAKVTQFGDEDWLRERQVRWHPKRNYGARHGLNVIFVDNTYTLGEHLEKIGWPLTTGWKASRTDSYGPGRPYSKEQLRTIFSDPKVLMIEETSGGMFHDGSSSTSTQAPTETSGHNSLYTAPYEAWIGKSAAPDCYNISFKEGFQVTNSGYLDYDSDDPWIVHTGRTSRDRQSALTRQQREHARNYPGVAKIVQFGDDAWLLSRKVTMYPERGYEDHPARMVIFANRSYTAGEHFAKIGQVVDGVSPSCSRIYVADRLSDEQVQLIFSDPMVICIDQSTPGKFHQTLNDDVECQ
ncbi:hypothetical protein B0A48_16235 [Cryoendolithus antarcticus]|uniref:Uncharacterized protein n=1 Tax=Cryoendolithus antarcticus TaxID=1507870 RepID=A0A1V8SGF6_9PEZI|nr:hypothetical protein B0A48_16235 [Cryoendolithus antarcticus]